MLTNIHPMILICLGACAGAILRWQLSIHLQGDWGWGIWLANASGCLLIGMALAFSLQDSSKLLLITGFLGSFTTFSAFSAQVVSHLLAQKWGSALAIFTLHTVGGIVLTLIGFASIRWLQNIQAA